MGGAKQKRQSATIRVTRWLNEEQAAVDASVLDVALALGGELLSEVGRVLILDVFDDGIPASVVVDLVSVARGIDDVEAESDAVLLNDCNDVRRGGVRLGNRATYCGRRFGSR